MSWSRATSVSAVCAPLVVVGLRCPSVAPAGCARRQRKSNRVRTGRPSRSRQSAAVLGACRTWTLGLAAVRPVSSRMNSAVLVPAPPVRAGRPSARSARPAQVVRLSGSSPRLSGRLSRPRPGVSCPLSGVACAGAVCRREWGPSPTYTRPSSLCGPGDHVVVLGCVRTLGRATRVQRLRLETCTLRARACARVVPWLGAAGTLGTSSMEVPR